MKGMEMEIQRGAAFRLYPTPEQGVALVGQAHAARAMWNLLHEWWLIGGKHRRPTLKQADAAIRQARKDIDWLAALPAQAAQQVFKQYHRAWVNCWEGRAKPPNFKSRLRSRMTIDVPQASRFRIVGLSARWSELTIPNIGRVRFRTHRAIDGTLTGARIVQEANGWLVAFRARRDVAYPSPHPGSSVGIDRGIKVPLALSDGTAFHHGPWLRPKEAERLLRLERQSARQRRTRRPGERTSNRLHRTYDQIAQLRARATRRRSDWQHKTTRTITETYSLISIEDLRIANMVKSASGTVEQPGMRVAQKRGLNRSIQSEAWGQLAEQLAYKSHERGGALVRVPAPNTSRRCHACGFITPGSRESQARFVCKNPQCGWAGNADFNAACNIHHAAKQAAVIPAPGSGVAGRGALQPIGGAMKRQPKRKAEVT